MCAFPTIILNGNGVSPFCALFEDDDWVGFEYSSDVDKYYDTGQADFHKLIHDSERLFRFGQKLGPVQGVGWTNELIARLTNQPLKDSTQSNHSLPFPLNRTFYADFTHDTEMIAIFSAIGLFKQSDDLPETKMPSFKSTWEVSMMVPFAARMVVERLTCSGQSGQFVRFLVNDQVQSLGFCDDADSNGLCSLDNFVESQSFATSGGDGDWQKCFK